MQSRQSYALSRDSGTTRRRTAAVAILALLGSLFTATTTAVADPGDGTLTVSVTRVFTESGVVDPALDVPQAGIDVIVTDAAGTSVLGVTDDAGEFVLAPHPDLAGGRYRVEVAIPAALSYLQPAFATGGAGYGTHVGFVDVSGGVDAVYRTAVWNPGDYVQENPRLAVPLQVGEGGSQAGASLFEWSSSPRGNWPGRTQTNSQAQVGTLYGTAYNRYTEELYSAAYAKRHTAYGPGGPGAVYVSPLSSNTATLFAVIPDAGSTEHTLPLRNDPGFFAVPGRESLGDIELSEDGSTLWVVNMNDRQLYGLDTATAEIETVAPIPDPGCVGGDWRPMGLGVQDGKVYVGGICDAFDSQLRADLLAAVYESADGISFTKIIEHSLDFLRGRVNDPGVVDVNTHWNPWYDEWDTSKYYSAWVHAFPQPLLSDIDFDRDGSILLGFRDRFGDQIGPNAFAPNGQSEGNGSSAAGDIIKVCLIAGDYVWEGEGACPSNVQPDYHGGTANRETSEYFVGESALGGNHQEPGLGSIAPLFRTNDVVMTTIDPFGAWQQGVQYLDLTDGTGLWRQSGRGGSSRGQAFVAGVNNFNKGNGLGDLSVLADPAPIQIGNTVWFDADRDGIQDPDEAPLPGVTVELLDEDGNVLASTVTNDDGDYFFSSLTSPLTPNGRFQVRFVKPADGETVDLGGAVGVVDWAKLELTDPVQGPNPAVDSDPDPATGTTDVITTGGPGANDHTIDAGFILLRLPGWEHDKSSDPAPGAPVVGGDDIAYILTGRNTGDLPLDVDLADDLADVLADASVTDGPAVTVYDVWGDVVPGVPAASVVGDDLTWSGPVPAGGRVEVVYTATLDADVAAGTIVANALSSVATAPPGDYDPVIEPDPVTVEHPVPGFEHSKSSDPPAGTAVLGTAPNNVIGYTLRGENTGITDLAVEMTDDLSRVLQYDGTTIGAVTGGPTAIVYEADGTPSGGANPAAEVVGTTLRWIGTLTPGQYVEIDYSVTLNEEVPDNYVVLNGLSSRATPPGGDPIVPDEVYLGHPTPAYAHAKTSVPASGSAVQPGDTIAYLLQGWNSGAADLEVEFSDDLSGVLAAAVLDGDIGYAVFDAVDAERSSGVIALDADDRLEWSVALAPGERVEIRYTVRVAEDAAGAVLRNAMTSQATANETVILPEPPEIATEHPVAGYGHEKTSTPAPGTAVYPGDEIEYTVVARNQGAAPLESVTVTDDLTEVLANAELPPGTVNGVVYDATDAVVSTTPATRDGDALSWTGRLEPGERVELVYTVTVRDGAGGTLVNALSSEAWPEEAREPIVPAEVELEHPIPAYEHEKSSTPASGSPVVGGDTVEYLVVGRNTGATVLDPVEVVDDLSAVLVDGVTLLGAPTAAVFRGNGQPVTPAPAPEADGAELTWTGVLEAGGWVELRYTVRLGAELEPGVVLENRMTSTATVPDGTELAPEEVVLEHPVPGIDIVKFDGRDPADVPADPVDGPSALGPTPGDWAADVDADTAFDAALYDVADDGTSGDQPVRMIVTNTGALPLTDLVVGDETLYGVEATDLSCDFSPLGGPATGTAWEGPLAPGESFECLATLVLTAPEDHGDRASVAAVAVVELDGGETAEAEVGDTDDFHAATPVDPSVAITKRDLASQAEADDADDPLIVPSDARTIEIVARNTGTVPLTRVVLTDTTVAGVPLEELECHFPDGTTGAVDADGLVVWQATFDDPDVQWLAGVEFTCTATLTIPADDPLHRDVVEVSAASETGDEVRDENPFTAGVPAIDVVKFDARRAADVPANPVDGAYDGGATPGDWAAGIDADTGIDAVRYVTEDGTTGPQPVGIIVTNTGAAVLEALRVVDHADAGPALEGLTCDFSPLGGPSTGTEWVGPFLPGDDFTCVGTIELAAGERHADTIEVLAEALVTNVEGQTETITVGDRDEFHAIGVAMAITGLALGGGIAVLAILLVLAGVAFLLVGRRVALLE